MERDTRITVRMAHTVREALEAAAEAERRSVSDLAVIVLGDWLVERGYLKAGAPQRRRR